MRLAFRDEGPGPAVVLLHGFPLSGAMWKEQIAGIGSIYRLIVPDLRGHGDSPAPEGVYTMDEMADDVIELLDTLSVDVPVVVGGLSMGGYVALSLVLRYPARVRGLMLMDTRAGADSPEAAQKREEMAQTVIAADSAGPVVESMVPRLFAKTTLEQRPERVALLREVMEQTTPRGIAGALAGHGLPSRSSRRPGQDRCPDARTGRGRGCDHPPGGSPGPCRCHLRSSSGSRLEQRTHGSLREPRDRQPGDSTIPRGPGPLRVPAGQRKT